MIDGIVGGGRHCRQARRHQGCGEEHRQGGPLTIAGGVRTAGKGSHNAPGDDAADVRPPGDAGGKKKPSTSRNASTGAQNVRCQGTPRRSRSMVAAVATPNMTPEVPAL